MRLLGVMFLCSGVLMSSAAPQDNIEIAAREIDSVKPTIVSAPPIPILSQYNNIDENGGYKYSYESENGIKVEETSFVKSIPFRRTAENSDLKDAPDYLEIRVQEGSYSYIAPDGSTIRLKYIADENGFQPIGDHLPVQPQISKALQPRINQNPDVETFPQDRRI